MNRYTNITQTTEQHNFTCHHLIIHSSVISDYILLLFILILTVSAVLLAKFVCYDVRVMAQYMKDTCNVALFYIVG